MSFEATAPFYFLFQ